MRINSALAGLSIDALRYVEALGASDVAVLFEHLYTYNTVPSSETWERLFPETKAVKEELGLSSDGRLGTLLTRQWVEMPEEAADDWLTWIRPSRYERLAGSESRVQFKLYLSPALEALPTAVVAWVETLSFSQAISFKLGANAADLLRPDKIIAYFERQADLAEAARQLAGRLVDVPPQGVPFTAEIAGDGLLSWGVDPPTRDRALGQTARSWREWVCYQLAVALAEEQEEESGNQPRGQQALERLRIMGVDTDRWLPPTASWASVSS